MNSARFRAYVELLIVVVIWGIAPPVIKFALGEIKPFFFLFYRFLITSIALIPFYLASKNKALNLSNLFLVIIASFLGSTATLGLLFYGTELTTSLDASLISATSPIFIILAGIIFLREHVTKREKIGLLLTILGTIIVSIQAIFEPGPRNIAQSILGNVIIFASNIAFAASVLLSKKALKRGVSPFSLMFMMFIVGLFTTLPLAYAETGNYSFIPKIFSISKAAHLSVWYMAFLSGALAYFLYQKAQKTIEASEAAIFLYLQPLVTAPVSLIWLHESLTIPFVVGSIVIALGVILAESKRKRYNSKS